MASFHKSICFLVLFFITFISSTHAYTFQVGGKDGWTLHPNENYNSWSGRLRFLINDTLHFKYDGGTDSVLVVNKGDYDGCNGNNPIKKLEGGDSMFKLDRSGQFYFISGNKTNCDKGLKMILVVLSMRNHSSPPSVATPPSPSTLPPSTSPGSPPSTVGSPGFPPSTVGSPASPPSTWGSPGWPPSTVGTPSLPPSTVGSPVGSPELPPSRGPILSPPASSPGGGSADSPGGGSPDSPEGGSADSPGGGSANSPGGAGGGQSSQGGQGAAATFPVYGIIIASFVLMVYAN